MKKQLSILIVAIVVVGSGAFYGGMKYAQSKGSAMPVNSQTGGAGFAGRGGTRGGRNGGGGAAGDIIAKDEKSIIVRLQDGGSQIVFFTASTPIAKSTAGSANDLSIGTRVMTLGAKNPDGSISAQSIQIRPPMRQSGAQEEAQ